MRPREVSALATLFLVAPLVCSAMENRAADDDVWLDGLLGLDETADDVGEWELLYDNVDTQVDPSAGIDVPMPGLWLFDTQLSGGMGWRDNVLLSEGSEVSSSFAQLEADVFAMRTPLESGPEIVVVGYGEYRDLTEVEGLDGEALVLLSATSDWTVGSGWKLGLVSESAYSQQAFDASLMDFESEAAAVSVFQPELGGRAAWSGARWGAFMLQGMASKVYYDEAGQDYDRQSWEIDWSRQIEKYGTVGIAFEMYQENYDERMERLSVGMLSRDELLTIDGSELEASWKLQLGEGFLREARTVVRLEKEDDLRGDYYERSTIRIQQSVEFRWNAWNGKAGVGYSIRDYEHRLAVVGGEETRSDEGWDWNVRVERPINERFDWLFRCEGSDRDSNASGFSYDAMGVFAGLRWKLGGES